MNSAFPVIGAEAPSLLAASLRLFLATGAVVAIGLACRKWLPRLLPAGIQARTRSFVEVIGRQYVSPRKALVVVSVENRRLLLSETPDGFRLITELEGDFARDLRDATARSAS